MSNLVGTITEKTMKLKVGQPHGPFLVYVVCICFGLNCKLVEDPADITVPCNIMGCDVDTQTCGEADSQNSEPSHQN